MLKNSCSIALLALLITFSACSGDSTSTPQKEKKAQTTQVKKTKKEEKKPAEKQQEKSPYPKLNNNNVTDFLAEYGKKNKEQHIKITTRFGEIELTLYNDTPIHRANFIYLTKRGFFNHTEFYRVTENFVIQGGDSDEYDFQDFKGEIGTYRLHPEFKEHRIHKHGAIAMAREYENNPEKKSSSFEFYIVIGEKRSMKELAAIEREYGITIPEENKAIYTSVGGTPHLDGQHTVFGEVTKGMDVVREISNLETDTRDWPYESVPMKIEIIP